MAEAFGNELEKKEIEIKHLKEEIAVLHGKLCTRDKAMRALVKYSRANQPTTGWQSWSALKMDWDLAIFNAEQILAMEAREG